MTDVQGHENVKCVETSSEANIGTSDGNVVNESSGLLIHAENDGPNVSKLGLEIIPVSTASHDMQGVDKEMGDSPDVNSNAENDGNDRTDDLKLTSHAKPASTSFLEVENVIDETPEVQNEYSNELVHSENKVSEICEEGSNPALTTESVLMPFEDVKNVPEEKHEFPYNDSTGLKDSCKEHLSLESDLKENSQENSVVSSDNGLKTEAHSTAETVVQKNNKNEVTGETSAQDSQTCLLDVENKEELLQEQSEAVSEKALSQNLTEKPICINEADKNTGTIDNKEEVTEFPNQDQSPLESKVDLTTAEHEAHGNCKNVSVNSEAAGKTEGICVGAEVESTPNVNNSPNKEDPKAETKDAQVSTPPAPSKKGIMQLEQMSREDLLKQCKRQLLFLQKTKMKNDDLSRNLLEFQNENKVLKESSMKTGVSAELLRRLQSENDRLMDEKESQSDVVAQLNKDISKLVVDLANCKEQMEESKGKCNQLKESLAAAVSEKKTQDALVLELQSQIIVLRSERDTDLKKMGEKHSKVEFWEAKCSSLQEQLEAKNKDCLELQASLTQFKQELEQERVMNLEISDYERTLSELNGQLAREAKAVEELNSQLLKMKEGHDVLQKEIDHLEHQCLSEESRSAHLKETLENTRHQLASKCEDHDRLSSALVQMKQQKEDILTSKEELQYQLSVSASNLLVLEGELKQTREQSEKSDFSLKSRISSLTEELCEARQQLETSRKEFHSYKVRVHSVLKQQKGSGPTSGQPVSNFSVHNEEQKGQIEWTLELCKGKIAQLTEQVVTLTVERDSLQKEQEWLFSKQNLLTEQMKDHQEASLQRLEELRQELDLSRALWDTEKQQLQQQQKNLVHEYDHRLSSVEAEHERHVCRLVNQLEQLQKSSFPFIPSSVQDQAPQRLPHQGQIFDFMPTAQLSPSVDESFDICSQERQEGEGSECTDPLPAPAAFQTLVTSPASGFMPLDRLLQTEVNPTYGNQDPEIIAVTINTLQKKVDHISELLNESEASNLRLSEQTRLLKEEIRRLERNTERHEHFANFEYLKNIVLKFSTTPNGSEKERLVPVISTLLRLSPEEQTQMKLVANQDAGESNNTAGWGNYLHRWSGLV